MDVIWYFWTSRFQKLTLEFLELRQKYFFLCLKYAGSFAHFLPKTSSFCIPGCQAFFGRFVEITMSTSRLKKQILLAQLEELEHKFSKSAYPKVPNQVHCLTSLQLPHSLTPSHPALNAAWIRSRKHLV